MKDIIIKIERKTSQVFSNKKVLGINGENLQGNIVFEFLDQFVDGIAWLELETKETKGYLLLTKENNTYKLPILSSLLAKKGYLTMQLRITESENVEGIPVFKSNEFYLEVKGAINSTETIEEQYPSWVDMVNEKINVIKTDGKGNKYLSDDGTYKYVEGGGSNGGDGEIDLSGYATKDDLLNKVDKELGKSLISNNEIERLANVTNYDDTAIKNQINSKASISDMTDYIEEHKDELKGDKGDTGQQGIQGERGLQGEKGDDGYTPIKGTDYFTAEDKQEIVNETASKISVPTKTSQLTNDSGFLTSVPSQYVTETELTGKGYLTSVPSTYKTKTENDALYQAKGNYLTSYTETDPLFKASASYKITNGDITNWNSKSNFSGNYDDLTNKPTIPSAYTLPVASANTLGGIKVGANLSIEADGTLNASASGGSGGNAESVDGFSFWSGTQTEYDAITTKDANTVYLVKEE